MINNVLSNFFSPNTVQYFRIDGKVPYHVEAIETKGRLPFNTCTVAVKAYTTKDKTVEIPIKIKWYKLQAERNYEIEELENSREYSFSAMDIGGEIKANIRSMDDNLKGTVAIIFGPIKFDDNLRPPLESVLLSGFSKFNVMVHEDDSSHPDKVQPISVFMSPNQIKFFYYTGSEEENFYLEISNERPKLEIVYQEPENLILYFEEVCVENDMPVRRKIYKDCNKSMTESHYIHLRFFSRNSRDIFVTAIRLFRIVPVVTLSNLFRQIDVLLRENRLFEGNNKVTLNEVLVEYDLLRTNLLNTIEYAKDLDKDREELQECVTVLERDLEHTMTEFKKYIEDNLRNGTLGNAGASANNKSGMDGLKRFDDLNSSLVSNRADIKKQIKQKLDESSNNIKDKVLRQQSVHHNAEELSNALAEVEKVKKLNAMYLKKIKEYEAIKEKKKETLKAVKAQMGNVSREINNFRELNESMNRESKMQSQMFDVSQIESRMDEDDMFGSTPFGFENMKKKPTPKIEQSNLFKIDEKEEKLGQSQAMELRVKDEEINVLKSRLRDMEAKFAEMAANDALNTRRFNSSYGDESVKLDLLNKELAKAQMKEKELIEQADKSLKYIEDFRKLMKAVIAEDEPNLKPPMNSSLIDESLMNDVFKVNLNTKIKMMDLENDNLKKRVNSLTKEVYILREENRNLKSEGGSGNSSSTQLPSSGPSKEEFDNQKKQIDNLTTENDNLRVLINRLKTTSSQEDNSAMNSRINDLKKEIADLTSVNQSLLQQKQDLARKLEQVKSQVQGDAQSQQRSETDERRDKLIIEQLTKTNERLMGEINRLEEKMRTMGDGGASFISDVNDSYMSSAMGSRFK
jgi:hypothetical protein